MKRRAIRATRDYTAVAKLYAQRVVGGEIAACKWLRLACERQLRDLERQRDRAWPYRFDRAKANRVCAFVEGLRHVKGRWAACRQRIKLEAWQVFVIATLFGWVAKRGGQRRFREAYLEIPRKNGKSVLGAALALYMLLEDGEHFAEVYAGATSEKQALEVFVPARLMVSEAMRERHGLETFSKAIVRPEDNSRMWPVIGRPGDGLSPSCAVIDEYHEHDTPDLYDSMVSGMGAREQPLTLIITTAGANLASACFEKHTEAQKMLEGVTPNEELFAVIWSVDEEDDWTTPAALEKANPNIGVSVDREYLLAQQRQAVANAAHQNRFKTKHLNVWTNVRAGAVNMADWHRCADRALTLEAFEGEEAKAGVDLASKLDLAAAALVFTRTVEGARHYYAFTRSYLPGDAVADGGPNAAAYAKWARIGHLVLTEGAEIDHDVVRDDILDWRKRFAVAEVVYDPARATMLAQHLVKAGMTVVEFTTTSPAAMGAAFDELLAAIRAGRFHHDGNEVLTWAAANVVARPATKGIVVPSKVTKMSHMKIDPIVAVCLALYRAMFGQAEKPKRSVYETRGVIAI